MSDHRTNGKVHSTPEAVKVASGHEQLRPQAAVPLRTGLATALEVHEIHDACVLKAIAEMEQALHALRTEAHATGIQRLHTMHRDGDLEVVWVGMAEPLPCIYWLIHHEGGDRSLTQWIVLEEFELLDEAEDAMAQRILEGATE